MTTYAVSSTNNYLCSSDSGALRASSEESAADLPGAYFALTPPSSSLKRHAMILPSITTPLPSSEVHK